MSHTPPVTGLYVPGDRPDRFDKAVSSGADLVILDLEDAVAPEAKVAAREAVAEWLNTSGSSAPCALEVRINADNTNDLDVLGNIPVAFGVRVPKVEKPEDLDQVETGRRPVTALIETALGVENALSIATHPAVRQLGLGESDLSSDLGCRSSGLLNYARTRLLFAARAAHLPAPMMSPYPDIRDAIGLRSDTEQGVLLGWSGRIAIHPSQLAVITEVFSPSEADLEWSRQVIAAMKRGGVATLPSGEMIDPAMVGRAQALLAQKR